MHFVDNGMRFLLAKCQLSERIQLWQYGGGWCCISFKTEGGQNSSDGYEDDIRRFDHIRMIVSGHFIAFIRCEMIIC